MKRLAPLAAVALAALLALALSPGLASAQGEPGPEVQLTVDRARPAADDTIRVTFTFTGPGAGGSLRAPSALPLKNLRVVAGPNTSTQISFINGDLKRSSSLTYFVRPVAAGAAEVGETTWRIGDRDVKVAAYPLDVGPPRRPGEAPGPGAGPGVLDEPDDPFERFFGGRVVPNRAAYDRSARREEPLVALLATPDRTTAYVGEEVVVHYELVTQTEIQGIEWVEVPKFPGCWAEDVERPDRPTPRRDTIDGRPVVRFTLLRKAVSGLSPGTVELPPARVKLLVRSGDPFLDPFASLRPQIAERETKPITLKIVPIPGNPSFKGPVGQFDLTASLDRTSVPAGEAATLKVKLSGTGNLRTVTEPPALEVPGARVYPPTTRGGGARSGSGRGPVSMEWDYVVVPSEAGTVSIPPVELSVFDPVARKIVAKATQKLALSVKAAPGAAPAATPVPASAAEGAGAALTVPAAPVDPEPAQPVRPAPTAPARAVDLARQTVSVPLWAVIAVPLVLLAGTGVGFVAVGRRRARRALLCGLDPEPGETKERAADRIERAVRAPLGRRLGVPEGAPLSALLDALERSDLDSALRDEVKALFAEVDFLRFAPQLGDYAAEIEKARDRAAAIIPRVS